MKKLFLLAIVAVLITGCATNQGLDHKAVCIDGKMKYLVTYGPIALTDNVDNLNYLCPQPVPASPLAPAPGASAASAAK